MGVGRELPPEPDRPPIVVPPTVLVQRPPALAPKLVPRSASFRADPGSWVKGAAAAKSAGVERSKLPCGLKLLYSSFQRLSERSASSRSICQCCDKHSRLRMLLNASMYALSVGLPGRLKSSFTLFQYAQ